MNNTLTAIWDLPYGRGRHWGSNSNYALQTLAGGWQFTIIETATSGQPVNLIYSEPSQFDVSDLLNYRPNVSGNPKSLRGSWVKTPTSLTGYLSSSTVSVPTDVSHPYGNAGRNSFRDNAYYSMNAGLHKQFPLWSEGSNLDFRCEAFNALNSVNYQAPDSNRQDGGFGAITILSPPPDPARPQAEFLIREEESKKTTTRRKINSFGEFRSCNPRAIATGALVLVLARA